MNVTIYEKPNCPQCVCTKRYLDKQGVAYSTSSALDNLEFLKSLGHLTAPVVVLTDLAGSIKDSWSGFNPNKCKSLVAKEILC